MSGYSVFLSSPGDVQLERDRVQAVIDRLNADHPSGQPLFTLTRWEQSFYSASETFQKQIKSPGEHDLVVFLFWKRLGTELPPAYNRRDGTTRTGTEYEFEEARDARERRADNLPDIFVYRKTARILYDEESVDAERAQKKALDQFWERWFRSSTGHFIAGFHSIAEANDLERQLERHLREWLRDRHAEQVTWNIALQGSPYRGLDAIDETHASLFFGRDSDMRRARARFIEAAIGPDSGRRGTPFLLILGASGCGKSSFLRAGLVPRMRAGGVPAFLEDGSDAIHAFRTLTVMPREMGEDLCRGLAVALYRRPPPGSDAEVGLAELAEGDYATPEAFAELAASSPTSASAPIRRALDRIAIRETGPDAPEQSYRRLGLLLAIDQMEELFARPESDRRAFVRLLTALTATGRVFVAATMRNDFYDRLRQDPELSALVDRGRIYDLAPPTLADYRDIIRRPALAAGLRFESNEKRDLAAEIETEAGSEGSLPMIAFLLDQLFRERRGEVLTLETYDRLGGAAGALAQHGDQVFAALPEEVQAAFPRVVRRLVRKSLQDLAPTAAAAPLAAFAPGSPERALEDALSQARLVRTFSVFEGTGAGSAFVRWSHEALLTRWPRLRNSVDADRRDYETLDRLQSAYSLWQSTLADQQSGRLITDLALAEALDLLKRWSTDVDEPLRQFVEASYSHAEAGRRRRRFRRVITLAGVSVLAVVASVGWFNAVRQSGLVRAEQAAADRTSNFMVHLFALADPSESRGKSITVKEVLDRGNSEMNASQDLAREPRIRADLLTAMGQAYSGLGLYPQAEQLLAQARKDQSHASPSAESRVRTLLAYGTNVYMAGRYAEALLPLQQAVEIARRELSPQDVLRSQALAGLAEDQVQLGEYAQAEHLCEEALAVDRARGADQASVLARTLDVYGEAYFFSGDLPRAEVAMREALALHERATGLHHAVTAVAMNNLAVLLAQEGHYTEAEDLSKKVLPVYREVYGDTHPEVATLLNNIGRLALMAGRVDEAEPLLRQTLAIDTQSKGPTHFDLVSPLNSLAMIDAFRGRLADAHAEIERAEHISRLPDQDEFLDQVLVNLAGIDLKLGNKDAAAASLTEAHKLLQAKHPLEGHPAEVWRYAVWDSANAELLAARGDPSAARKLLLNAQPVIARRFGDAGFYSQLLRRRLQQIP